MQSINVHCVVAIMLFMQLLLSERNVKALSGKTKKLPKILKESIALRFTRVMH